MKIVQLRNIRKLYFGYEDIARALNISMNSARVAAHRYSRAGVLVRVKRNIYMLYERWIHASLEEKFVLANLIQVPSYISLLTALEYYEITSQIQQQFIESIAPKRTRQATIGETFFNYTRISSELYFGFGRQQGFFIAEAEKALLDALYLMSLGRYRLDMAAIDWGKLQEGRLQELTERFPRGTKKLLERYADF